MKLEQIATERPVGTKANNDIVNLIHKEALQLGCDVTVLPFECKVWEEGDSCIEVGNRKYDIHPSPFSTSFSGEAQVFCVNTLNELQAADLTNKIAFLQGELAETPLMPKDFPFYYPDEHKQIIDLLEQKGPKAIVAVTGKHPMCGLNPFPLFEDGNFKIPSAFINRETEYKIIKEKETINLKIDSKVAPQKSSQIIATHKAEGKSSGKIIICAHMDSKYGTSGALDNAAGVCVLLETMEKLKNYSSKYDIEFVPFNSEECYAVKGQLEYMNYKKDEFDSVKLVINIDSPGFIGSQTAVSSYNFNDELTEKLNGVLRGNVVTGPQWYAGDHVMFTFRGIPCITLISSDFYNGILELTHTKMDTADKIDTHLINEASDFLSELIKTW